MRLPIADSPTEAKVLNFYSFLSKQFTHWPPAVHRGLFFLFYLTGFHGAIFKTPIHAFSSPHPCTPLSTLHAVFVWLFVNLLDNANQNYARAPPIVEGASCCLRFLPPGGRPRGFGGWTNSKSYKTFLPSLPPFRRPYFLFSNFRKLRIGYQQMKFETLTRIHSG